MKTIRILAVIFAFLSIFTSCNKPIKIDNKFLTAVVPSEYVNATDFKQNDVLYLHYLSKDGLESIFSVDNTQDLIIQPNAQTIKEFTPIQRLTSRLRSIEEGTKLPNFNWKNFTITKQPKELKFKGYNGAEATFTVDEKIEKLGKTVKRKIKRMIVFKENDLWNFVLAPSELKNYETEMKTFDEILQSIEIKK